MISQAKLLKVIDEDIDVCRGARHSHIDGLSRQTLELATLTKHWDLALDAGEDQYKLELVVLSLEENPTVAGYQRWRERSTV
jgi:hypothetical protein